MIKNILAFSCTILILLTPFTYAADTDTKEEKKDDGHYVQIRWIEGKKVGEEVLEKEVDFRGSHEFYNLKRIRKGNDEESTQREKVVTTDFAIGFGVSAPGGAGVKANVALLFRLNSAMSFGFNVSGGYYSYTTDTYPLFGTNTYAGYTNLLVAYSDSNIYPTSHHYSPESLRQLFTNGTYTADIIPVSIGMNLQFDIPMGGIMRPYIQVGAAFDMLFINSYMFNDVFRSESPFYVGPAVKAGFGIRYPITAFGINAYAGVKVPILTVVKNSSYASDRVIPFQLDLQVGLSF